jgi:hypothetical protein
MNKRVVYIVGGGSSLDGFCFDDLRDKETIAVNKSALTVPDPTYTITADSGIFQQIQEGLLSDINTMKVLVTNADHCSMKRINKEFVHVRTGYVYDLLCMDMIIQNKGCDGIGFSFADFRTGYNSGFCAFQFAVLLGYTHICLLGMDMDASGKHYSQYGGGRIAEKTMDKFYFNFVLALGLVHKETDIKVFSCSPISRLNNIIPYMSFQETCNL